jgi:hypothetical protein
VPCHPLLLVPDDSGVAIASFTSVATYEEVIPYRLKSSRRAASFHLATAQNASSLARNLQIVFRGDDSVFLKRQKSGNERSALLMSSMSIANVIKGAADIGLCLSHT